MHESDSPSEPGGQPPSDSARRAPRPRRRGFPRGERASLGHEHDAGLTGETPGAEAGGASEAPPTPSAPTPPPRPAEEQIASRSTEDEARDLVAIRRARQGDDASFAEVLRADDPTIHAFVAALVGPATVEQVLTDTYVKAYRALPLAPEMSPRLWLLHLASTACADEDRRRTRNRMRDRPDRLAPAGPPEPPGIPLTLDTEHRVMLALVDGAGLTVREAAKVTGLDTAQARARLHEARLAAAELPVSYVTVPHRATFWNDIGEALLRARATPAKALPVGAPPPAETPPALGGRRPRSNARRADALRAAERARHDPGGVPWQKVGLAAGIALAAIAVVSGAAWLVGNATHRDASLGLTSGKVLDRVDHSLTIDDTISTTLTTTVDGKDVMSTLLRTSGGSYRITRTSPALDEAWDAVSLRSTRLADGTAGTPPSIVDVSGVSPGPPGLPTAATAGLGDPLLGAVRLLRLAGGGTVSTDRVGDTPVWVLDARLDHDVSAGGETGLPGVGSSGAARRGDALHLVVDQSLLLPLRFRQSRDGKVVEDIRFGDYAVGNPVPPGSFVVPVPDDAASTTTVTRGAWGFHTVGLDQARTAAPQLTVTPSYTPDGFVLASVALRDAQPDPAPEPSLARVVDRAGPVVVVVYRKGSQQIVISSRPPAAGEATGAGSPWPGGGGSAFEIGSGRFADRKAHLERSGVPRLWVADKAAVVTVAGDVSGAELRKVASSLR